MKSLKNKISILILATMLIAMMPSSIIATVAYSGESINSLSISSNRSENSYQYLIEIDIQGIDTSKVDFEVEYQTLYLLAHQGSVVSDSAISGAQVIRLAYDFPTNAVIKKYFRINHPNKIIISIPKA